MAECLQLRVDMNNAHLLKMAPRLERIKSLTLFINMQNISCIVLFETKFLHTGTRNFFFFFSLRRASSVEQGGCNLSVFYRWMVCRVPYWLQQELLSQFSALPYLYHCSP